MSEHRKKKIQKKFSAESQGFAHLYFSLRVSEEQRVRFAYTKCLANKFLFPDSESTSAGRLSDISNGKKAYQRQLSNLVFFYTKT